MVKTHLQVILPLRVQGEGQWRTATGPVGCQVYGWWPCRSLTSCCVLKLSWKNFWRDLSLWKSGSFLSILVSNFETFAFHTRTFSPRGHYLCTFKIYFYIETEDTWWACGGEVAGKRERKLLGFFSHLNQLKAAFSILWYMTISITIITFFTLDAEVWGLSSIQVFSMFS